MKSLELNHDLFHILKRIFWFSGKKKKNLECRWRWKVRVVPSLHSQGQVPQTSNLPLWAGGMWKRATLASRCQGQLKEAEQVGTACGWRSLHKLGWMYQRCEKRNTSLMLQGSFTEFSKLGSEGPWTPTDESWAYADSLRGYLKFCVFILIMTWKEKSQYKHILGNLD